MAKKRNRAQWIDHFGHTIHGRPIVPSSAAMGSGGSALQEATAQQVQEAFAGLSPEEQKKVADALVLVSKAAGPAEDAPTPGLSEEQRAMLKAAYADIDTNKSGTIEVSEFKSVMQKMKVQLTDEQIEGVFKRADLNKDQKLSYDEYEKLVVKGLYAA
eukprot:s648_g9.t1